MGGLETAGQDFLDPEDGSVVMPSVVGMSKVEPGEFAADADGVVGGREGVVDWGHARAGRSVDECVRNRGWSE